MKPLPKFEIPRNQHSRYSIIHLEILQ